MELPVEMDGRVRGLLGRHLLSKLGVVAVMIRIKKEMGFKACPFCGSIGFLAVTSEDSYESMRGRTGGDGILRVSCEKCNLDFWRNSLFSTPENKGYQFQLESLRARWNERAE